MKVSISVPPICSNGLHAVCNMDENSDDLM